MKKCKTMTISIKTIRQINYLYFSYSDNKTHKQKFICCGVRSKKESKIKALELELNYLQEQIASFLRESSKIKDQLQNLK